MHSGFDDVVIASSSKTNFPPTADNIKDQLLKVRALENNRPATTVNTDAIVETPAGRFNRVQRLEYKILYITYTVKKSFAKFGKSKI